MGLTRADLERTGKDLDLSDEEWAQELEGRQLWIDRTRANDQWNKKIFNEIGILLTSHQANRPYLKACLETHAQLGLWITLAYDSYVDPTWHELDHNRFMPAKDCLDMVDMFLMPHYQTWGGVLYPYFWLLKWGAAAMSQFKWIYCTNGDFIIEKPDGFWKLWERARINDCDVFTSGPDRPPRHANTAGFFIKSEALRKVVQHMQERLVPWENYEKYTEQIGNAEGRFGRAISDLGLKQMLNQQDPKEDMFREPGFGTWAQAMGFRHIHAEHNFAYRHRGIPPHHKYLDPRFMGDEYNVIKQYHESGDEKVLEDWWARD